MILRDMGATVLVVGLLFAAHIAGKTYSPEYAAGYANVKAAVTGAVGPYLDKAERDYVDPYRTPTDGIDDPVWQPEN